MAFLQKAWAKNKNGLTHGFILWSLNFCSMGNSSLFYFQIHQYFSQIWTFTLWTRAHYSSLKAWIRVYGDTLSKSPDFSDSSKLPAQGACSRNGSIFCSPKSFRSIHCNVSPLLLIVLLGSALLLLYIEILGVLTLYSSMALCCKTVFQKSSTSHRGIVKSQARVVFELEAACTKMRGGGGGVDYPIYPSPQPERWFNNRRMVKTWFCQRHWIRQMSSSATSMSIQIASFREVDSSQSTFDHPCNGIPSLCAILATWPLLLQWRP